MYIRKIVVFIIGSLSCIIVDAQNSDTTNNFTIGAKIYFDNSGNPGLNEYQLNVVNYEINLTQSISNHFGIQTGIHVVTKATVLVALPFYYHYISIPLGVKYQNRLFYSMAGVFVDINYNQSSKKTYEFYNLPRIPKSNYGFYYGIGLEKEINRKVSLSFDFRELVDFESKDKKRTTWRFGMITYGFSFGVNIKM